VAATASTISAQTSVTVGLGAAVPIGSSADRLKPGYSAQLALAIQPKWMRHHLRFEGAVNSMTEQVAGSPKREFRSGTINLIVVGATRSSPTGYVVLGAGSYQQTTSAGRRTHPGINTGAGIRFSMGFFGTFVEARMHYIADDTKTKYFPMTFGLAF
jgi:hypothetical protein